MIENLRNYPQKLSGYNVPSLDVASNTTEDNFIVENASKGGNNNLNGKLSNFRVLRGRGKIFDYFNITLQTPFLEEVFDWILGGELRVEEYKLEAYRAIMFTRRICSR